MVKLPPDSLAEKLEIDPQTWEMIKIILKSDPLPEEQKSLVIDMRPAQKKLTDFFKK